MKSISNLLIICCCLLFAHAWSAYSEEGTYKAVEVSHQKLFENLQYNVRPKVFTVKAGKFVYPTKVYALTHFNSLSDFSAHVINDASYWGSYEYELQACAPFLGTAHIGIGEFSDISFGSYAHGYVVLGKQTSQERLTTLQMESEIFFQGNSIIELVSETPVAIFLRLNTQSGTIDGTLGHFYIESSPKTLDGTFEAKIYSLTADGIKNIEGKLLLNLYGEESLALAGGYSIGREEAGLVYLERKD